MARIEWTQEFEIGIPVLDTQQRLFVEFINELDEACRTDDLTKTNRVMENLLHYTVTHFELEEELLEKAEYPYLKAHRRVHEVFMKKVSELRGRSIKGENISTDLLELLKGWLKSHIQREDHDYVETLKKITESKDAEVSSWLGAKIKQFMS
ncbi:MAG: bacteriohemerythrin [Sideroxydans sp.]|nr:bacteriohemerythrin [Sideroxydans sp.]